MIDYAQGKIYMITSEHSDKIYIGSTCKTLSQRLKGHEASFKTNKHSSSIEILKLGDYKIELIKSFPCNSRDELVREEGKYIKRNKVICVNKVIAGRNNREYREDNKERIQKSNQQYRIDNYKNIQEYQNKVRPCACGGTFTYKLNYRHKLTPRHKAFLEQQNL